MFVVDHEIGVPLRMQHVHDVIEQNVYIIKCCLLLLMTRGQHSDNARAFM